MVSLSKFFVSNQNLILNMNINCTICSDLFETSDTIVTVSCGHCYHLHCITLWLEYSPTCPECRSRCTPTDTKRIFLNTVQTLSTGTAETRRPLLLDIKILIERINQQSSTIHKLLMRCFLLFICLICLLWLLFNRLIYH